MSSFEYYLAVDVWNRQFEDWEIRYYFGLASLFGEKEQFMYPCEKSYMIWKNNFRNVLTEAVGLDKYCVDYFLCEFGWYFDFKA